MESSYIRTTECLRDSGSVTRDMEADMKGSQMEMSIKETILKVKLMEKDFIHGLMGKYMTVNGKMESKRAMEYGKGHKVTLI